MKFCPQEISKAVSGRMYTIQHVVGEQYQKTNDEYDLFGQKNKRSQHNHTKPKCPYHSHAGRKENGD
jgi:hypothetical protein